MSAKMMTQAEINPYRHSDSNKRYQTYDYWLKHTFGGKCMKIPLDAGFTCPNIDGRCSRGGCIYCSDRGSGDFAESADIDIGRQFDMTREKLSSKWKTNMYIPYFQAHTNTYAPIDVLREKYECVLSKKGVVGINIATRADCLEDDVISYLADIAERKVLTVELGLQSVHDSTAFLINRGHTFEDFCRGYERLRLASNKINICVHLIFGLPMEDEKMMLESAQVLGHMMPHQVKIHLLHVIKNTALADMYARGEYVPMDRDDYIRTVANALTYIHEDAVIGRLTGDGMQSDLIAPEWSRKKTDVINGIDKYMFQNDLWQGKKFELSK